MKKTNEKIKAVRLSLTRLSDAYGGFSWTVSTDKIKMKCPRCKRIATVHENPDAVYCCKVCAKKLGVPMLVPVLPKPLRSKAGGSR